MTTKTTYAPYPPTGSQLVTGAGTLTRVTAPGPDAIIENTLDSGAGYVALKNNFVMDAVIYDSATGKADLSTPILSVHTSRDTGPLSIGFSKGLYIAQNSTSSIAVTYQ
ncbi:hypothetical protein AX768_13450 [Burkholderia sp. PAMC 28687]|uniref:hypothetical protein n=1 Tax=Burkholderia sp. PAMC 28687 TaxID=1795874 RepID=UPI0007839D99|nr:hypothetical protein [Burkholderia sp. PAMC 28687]AMM14952.1 hypothetical protein AX768_13450 [Burkholderia sp. PAMC 28687]